MECVLVETFICSNISCSELQNSLVITNIRQTKSIGLSRGNALELYSGGTPFESGQGHQLLWLRFFVNLSSKYRDSTSIWSQSLSSKPFRIHQSSYHSKVYIAFFVFLWRIRPSGLSQFQNCSKDYKSCRHSDGGQPVTRPLQYIVSTLKRVVK
jgi:hypothetical protein